jgi:methionyl-tRNA formyltransferase
MKNRALIISDNHYICKRFKEIVSTDSKYNKYEFVYAISPFSREYDFLPVETVAIDLRNDKDLNYIINNFYLVISIHCKQLFPPKLVDSVKCINVHPGYNPINRGWYPQVFSIINDLPIGATIHEIDNELDHGKIIVRELVEKNSIDTSLSLYSKVINKEIELLQENLLNILENSYSAFEPENDGNLYLKKDFNALCKIDLNQTITFKDCINKLRALTHGDYKNCYFIDENTGEKIFIRIILEKE